MKFGDYIKVEMNRYGSENEFYIHKVIGVLESNFYTDIPVIANGEPKKHEEIVKIVNCVQCGVCEDKFIRFKIEDVEKIKV